MMDNQFPGSDQIRQMQNLAALLAQYFTPGASQVNNFSGPPGATTTTTTNNNNNNNNAAPSQPTQPPQPLQQPQPTATPSAPSATSGADSVGGPRTQVQGQEPYIQQAIKLLRQQQQRQQQQRQQFQQQHQQQQQQLVSQEFTQRLQQQLHQIVQQSQSQRQQQQLQPSHSQAGEPSVSLTARQQQSMNPGNLIVNDQQKRKRGRPPLSKPSTSAGTSAIDFNYANVFAAVKKQQERDKESKLLERQRELRKQQELERQQEIRLAQERQRRQEEEMRLQYERQRLENERQRKAHHRMAMQDIERERRRQHMVMLRNLDAYKKNVEKEKLVNEAMVERNKQNERRIHQKRLEVELIKELRKPIDDMNLKNHQPLATFNRIPGLKLPGKAFADLLMSFEFLFNFSETIGLEPKTIPDINTLQQGLLNLNTWAEDQLCSILHHLCMFAVKDPRFPYTGSTKEIENLEATNEGLSQLLHFYLQVLTLNAKTEMEHEVRLFKLIEQKYFLALNATQKAEMLAFICNELLCSQTVTKQMEDTIENVAKLRKDKWVLENELRKFRAIRNKRELKEEAELKAKEEAEAFASNMNGEANTDEDAAIAEGSNNQIKGNIKKENDDKGKSGLTNGSMIVDDSVAKKENDTDTSTQQNITNDLDDLEPAMTNDELNRKIDNLIRQYNKTSNKLERAIHSMRASPLGQDRYRRRYWVLPQVGGVFVEGMESSEPEELENNKFTEEELEDYEKEQQALKELAKAAEESAKAEQSSHIEDPEKEVEIKDEKDDEKLGEEDMDTKEDGDEKDEDEVIETKDEEMADASEIREEIKSEPIENGEAEGDKIVTENVTEERAADVAPVPNLWFSILPRDSCDFTVSSEIINETNEGGDDAQKKVREEDGTETKTDLTDEELKSMRHEICPALSKKLEEFEAQQYELSKKIHPQFQYGWWRITDCGQLKTVLNALHERGTRERILHKHLMKNFNLASTSCKNTTVDFEITSFDRQLAAKNYGAPVPHTDEDSADDLRDGEEEDEEEEDVEELDEETADDKAIQPASAIASKKSKRKKTSRSARSRRLRARAAARKKVENSKNKLAQR